MLCNAFSRFKKKKEKVWFVTQCYCILIALNSYQQVSRGE